MDLQKKRRPKILFLASWYPNKEHPVSGIFIKRHAMAASKYCDIAVLYVHLGNIDDSIEVVKDNGILEVTVYKNLSNHSNKLIRELSRQTAQYLGYLQCALNGYKIINNSFGKPDLIHCNVILYAGFAALYLKLIKGIPYIITEHWAGCLKEDGTFNRRSPFGKALIKAIGKNAEAITTVSGKLRDAMIDCGIKNEYFVIPNVVDVNELKVCKDKNTVKQIHHVSLLKDDVKNVSGIIEAVKNLSQKRGDFELHIIGNGIDRRKLEDLAEGYGLLNKVIFFEGMVSADEVSGLLNRCDFFVLNSNFETFSVATAEALACGKPVIATKCGGPEEFVKADCGILIEPKDRDALVNAMDYMLDNFPSYNSKDIFEYAKSKFSSDAIGKELYSIYGKVAGRLG